MRIGITCYPTFGGSGVVATELGLALAKRGDDVHFISYAMPSRLNILHENVHFHEVNVTPYPLFDPYPPYTLALATKMAEVAAYEKLDVLHVHYAIPHAISAYLAKQIMQGRIQVVTTLHGTDITLVGRDESYLPITKFGIEVSDGVTAVSQWLKDETATNFNTRKEIEVIPNFVDPARFHRTPSAFCNAIGSRGEKIICHVSNFRPVKRVMDVVETFEKIIASGVNGRLIMIGDGPERSRAEAYTRQHHLRDRVTFLGNLPNLEEILGGCDLFLLPSETESFGMAALEAMTSEVPVIATNAGGLPEVVIDGETGYLLPMGDTDAMAERGIEILRDDELRTRMGKRARQVAVERFDEQKIIPIYREMYERVISK
ncbi:MAG TPA: N-acetyl-alpha-D-glucosaminyl L-malate synthase BshA [Thermoanaerobaculia bacterium]|jgi:N-acetyl-alpha-D-glucosaminyl L-malate synthase BshA|nr:N-acetyl-alpha-D-glucosaminyl L-malate synthase BshA [Thermoanaerobaculia bacterium]